jgi:quinol monooxygenase YgiN
MGRHGNNDIKDGIPAYSSIGQCDLVLQQAEPSVSHFNQGELKMLSHGLFVRLEAKPGKEKEVAAFLKQGLQLANQEKTTALWFSLRLGPATFGVFDAFADESGRQVHLNGPIAKALMAQAPDLLAVPPSIERLEILGAKLSHPA